MWSYHLVYERAFLITSRNLLTVIMVRVWGRHTTVRTNSKNIYITDTPLQKLHAVLLRSVFVTHSFTSNFICAVSDRVTTFKPNTSEHKHINPHNMAPTPLAAGIPTDDWCDWSMMLSYVTRCPPCQRGFDFGFPSSPASNILPPCYPEIVNEEMG